MYGIKNQYYSSFVFGFLDFELLKTMNLFDWFSICFVLAIEELILHLLNNKSIANGMLLRVCILQCQKFLY